MALFRNNRIEGLWLTLNQFQLFNETSPGIFFGFFGLSSKSLKVFCWLLLTLAGIWCFSKLPPPWLRPQNMMLQCGCADFVVMSCVVFAPSIPSGVIARKFESPKCLRGRKKKCFIVWWKQDSTFGPYCNSKRVIWPIILKEQAPELQWRMVVSASCVGVVFLLGSLSRRKELQSKNSSE